MALRKAEIWAELDATDEKFVREKFRRGGYSTAKQRLVGQWLAELEARRSAERAEVAAQRIARWTMVGGLAAALMFLLALGVAVVPLLK